MSTKTPQQYFEWFCKGRFEPVEWKFGRRLTDEEMDAKYPSIELTMRRNIQQSMYIGLKPPDPKIVPPTYTVLSGLLARDYLPAAVERFREAEAYVALGIARRAPMVGPSFVTGDYDWLQDVHHRTHTQLEQLTVENARLARIGALTRLPEKVHMPREWKEPSGPVGTPVEEVAYRLGVSRQELDLWLGWDEPVPEEYALQICRMADSKAYELLPHPALDRPGARAARWYLTGEKLSTVAEKALEMVEDFIVPPTELRPKADIAATAEKIGGMRALARYCRVDEKLVRRWILGEEDPTLEKRWAVIEANVLGDCLLTCLGHLRGPQATAIGGTAESRSALDVELTGFSRGQPVPSVDVVEATNYLLRCFWE